MRIIIHYFLLVLVFVLIIDWNIQIPTEIYENMIRKRSTYNIKSYKENHLN